ncbi:MAG: CvpA family protein [Devosia sp.]|nr:CvpA family protein [Devosia sp.]
MLTAFDVGVGILVLISAILATARGLTREVLSLATWAGSAAVAAYTYFNHLDFARGYIQEQIVADVATVVVSFIVALIVLHLITMRIADFVVDSKIGPLDRTLGFVFGVVRGVLIAVVVVIFGEWLLNANQPGGQDRLPSWAREARSLPILQDFGRQLIAVLPEDLEKQVTDLLRRGTGPDDAASPPDQAPSEEEEGTDSLEDSTPLEPMADTQT